MAHTCGAALLYRHHNIRATHDGARANGFGTKKKKKKKKSNARKGVKCQLIRGQGPESCLVSRKTTNLTGIAKGPPVYKYEFFTRKAICPS